MKSKAMHGGLDNATGSYEYIQNRGNDDGAGTSIFDPVLCELVYRWFSFKEAVVLDPFAGGSVRGIVGSKLERQYFGIELRKEQVEANIVQAQQICAENVTPLWMCGDSTKLDVLCPDCVCDLIFSCPPYGDLEVYSDDPQDISTLPYADFLSAYRKIVDLACKKLKEDRFACFVVGDFRAKDGTYRNFVSDTISAFLDAGLKLYNEAILVTSLGSLPIRAKRPFVSGRKLGKTHQNVLVFVKGDWKKAAVACGEMEMPEELFQAVSAGE